MTTVFGVLARYHGARTHSYLHSLADLWNDASNTQTALKMNVTDTSSPSGSKLFDFLISGVSKGRLKKDGELSALSLALGNTDADNPGVFLRYDAANIFGQRNGTAAQSHRIYNTYANSGTDYERATIGWTNVGNVFDIRVEKGGAGATRLLRLTAEGGSHYLQVGSANPFRFIVNGALAWDVLTATHIVPGTDNLSDFGAIATRVRNGFFSGYLTIGDGVTAPGATSGSAKLYVDSADGDLKVIFGDGTIKTIAVDT